MFVEAGRCPLNAKRKPSLAWMVTIVPIFCLYSSPQQTWIWLCPLMLESLPIGENKHRSKKTMKNKLLLTSLTLTNVTLLVHEIASTGSCSWLKPESLPLGLCVCSFPCLKCSSSALSMAVSFHPVGLSLTIPSSERPPMTLSKIRAYINAKLSHLISLYFLYRHYDNKLFLVYQLACCCFLTGYGLSSTTEECKFHESKTWPYLLYIPKT